MRKINIHLTLDERALSYCYEVNSGIRNIAPSIIDFGQSKPMIPHISLIMGELKNIDALSAIAEITRGAVGDQSALVFSVDPPYLENVRDRYVFSDVHAGEAFSNLKKKLQSMLNGKYLEVQTDYTEQPHLTLGHVEEHKGEVREFLKGVRAGFSMCCPAVEISDAGPKGTCINSLRKFDLT